MPKFAEDDELSSQASHADSAACRGEAGLPWQRAAKASKPEAALNPALKGWNLGRKDRKKEKYPCFSVGKAASPPAAAWGSEGGAWASDAGCAPEVCGAGGGGIAAGEEKICCREADEKSFLLLREGTGRRAVRRQAAEVRSGALPSRVCRVPPAAPGLGRWCSDSPAYPGWIDGLSNWGRCSRHLSTKEGKGFSIDSVGKAKKQNLKEINVRAAGEHHLPMLSALVWFSSQCAVRQNSYKMVIILSTRCMSSKDVPLPAVFGGRSWSLGLARRWVLAPLPSLRLVQLRPLFGDSHVSSLSPD